MNFLIFDGLLHIGKPVLSGMTVMNMLNGLGQFPSSGATGYYYVDYETTILNTTEATAANSAAASNLSTFRSTAPSAVVGYYSLLGSDNYYAPVNGGSELAAWQACNTDLTTNASCDYSLPSLYNAYPAPDPNWTTVAAAQISEYRRISPTKPCYAFVWYRAESDNSLIDPTDWATQLEYVQANADGIVLWGGYGENWNPNAQWWQIFKSVFGLAANDGGMMSWTFDGLIPTFDDTAGYTFDGTGVTLTTGAAAITETADTVSAAGAAM